MNNAKNYPLNCGTMASPPQWTHKKIFINERNFEITADEVKRITENGSVDYLTDKDLLLRNESFASYVSDFRITTSFRVPNFYENIAFSSENTDVLSTPEGNTPNDKIASFVSEGSCVFKGVASSGETSLCKATAQQYTTQDISNFLRYRGNSLAFHISNAVDQRIIGKNSSHRPLYTTQNHAAGIYVRNPDCFLSDIDLTCLSPWNSEGLTFMGGILVSPYHVLYCAHFGFYPNVGHTVRFITQNNTVVTRTITGTLVHPNFDPNGFSFLYDFTLIKLDEKIDPIIDGISYARVLPANWSDYLPSLSNNYTIPVIGTNQFERAGISQECRFLGTVFAGLPPTGNRFNFYEGMIRFDSGSPQFVIVNDQVVVLGPVTGSGSGNGSFVSYHMTALNNMMEQLGGLDENGDPYQLSIVDLSMFPTYPVIPPESFSQNDFYEEGRHDIEIYMTIDSTAKEEFKKVPNNWVDNGGGGIYNTYNPYLLLNWPWELFTLIDGKPYGYKFNYQSVELNIKYGNVSVSVGPHDVQARVKGFSSYVPYGGKSSFKIKIPAAAQQDLNGISVLTLNAMMQDKSKMREVAAYKIFRDFNLTAPRANHARLFINDSTTTIQSISNNLITTNTNHYLCNFVDLGGAEDIGASGIRFKATDLLPNIDPNFTYYVLSDGLTSNTFKISDTIDGEPINLPELFGVQIQFFTDFGIYLNLEDPSARYDLTNTKHLYEVQAVNEFRSTQYNAFSFCYEPDQGNGANRQDLINLLNAAQSTTNWYQNVSAYMDMQQMVNYFAVEAYIGNLDGYIGNAVNAYLHSTNAGIFTFSPWGLDRSFQVDFWKSDIGVLFKGCIEDQTCRSMYIQALQDVHNFVSSSNIVEFIENLYEEIIPDIETDQKDNTDLIFSQTVSETSLQSLLNFLSSRGQSLTNFLQSLNPPENFSYSYTAPNLSLSWNSVTQRLNGTSVSITNYLVEKYSDNTGWITHSEISSTNITINLSLLSEVPWKFRVSAKYNNVLALTSKETPIYNYVAPPPPPPTPLIRVTEVMSSATGTVKNDWFELKNLEASAVDITGWKADDSSGSFALAVSLTPYGEWTTIEPGEAVVFFEASGSTPVASQVLAFKNLWNIGTSPTNVRDVKIGTYSGSGVGLGSDGDGVVIFDSTGAEIHRVGFGKATTGKSFYWEYNSSGVMTTEAVVSQLGYGGTYERSFNVGSPGV
jgi:hypothetical protein